MPKAAGRRREPSKDCQQSAKLLAIALDLPKNSADDKAAIQSLLAGSLVGAGRPNDAVGPAKAALAYLDAKPRADNDSKDRASACETLADALDGADRLRGAASCLEKAAVYCFEDDKQLGTAGAQHLFNAAGALQKCGDGDGVGRNVPESGGGAGRPPEGRADGAGARRGGFKSRAEAVRWTEGSF